MEKIFRQLGYHPTKKYYKYKLVVYVLFVPASFFIGAFMMYIALKLGGVI